MGAPDPAFPQWHQVPNGSKSQYTKLKKRDNFSEHLHVGCNRQIFAIFCNKRVLEYTVYCIINIWLGLVWISQRKISKVLYKSKKVQYLKKYTF